MENRQGMRTEAWKLTVRRQVEKDLQKDPVKKD